MGFRDLKCFNQSLLAKQMWRLYEGTNPLLTTILKARFSKHDEVLNARRGFDPSFTLRSMWGAKSLLLEGLGWRVGSSWPINAMRDKWLMLEGILATLTLLNDNITDIQVGELKNSDSMT